MALVQISDVIVPDVFTQYMLNDTMEKAAVFSSGIVQADAAMSQLMSGGGRIFQHPFWKDLDNTEAVIPTDATTDVLSPLKIGTGKHQFVRQFRAQGWSAANLTAELAGSDPMKRISSRVSEYWARQFNRITVATLKGITLDNVANDSSDMVYDVSARTGTVTLANQMIVPAYSIHPAAVLEAKQTMGDEAGDLTLIVMHSRLYTNLQNQNQIAMIPASDTKVMIPYYLGYRVLVTDSVQVDTSGSDYIYHTYLCAPGILGWTENPPAKPVETKSEPLQGNGAGVEILVTRRQFALHPYGFTWTDTACAGQFPTTAEVATVTNWDRKYPERKQVKFAVLKTKNG